MQYLFLRMLPRGLTYFHMENLVRAFSFPLWLALPPHLTHLSYRTTVYKSGVRFHLPPSLMDSLAHLSLTASSSSTSEEECQISLPPHLTSLIVDGMLTIIPPALTSLSLYSYWIFGRLDDEWAAGCLPQTLTSLELGNCLLTSDVIFPPTLLSLSLRTTRDWSRFTCLPQSLENLDLLVRNLSSPIDWEGLPRRLLQLKFRSPSYSSSLPLGSIPPTLRSLDLDLKNLDIRELVELPKGLTKLRLEGEIAYNLHEQFCTSLPPNLTEIHLPSTHLLDSDYSRMPASVTCVQARGIYFSGALLPPGTTCYDVPAKVCFFRHPNGRVSFESPEVVSNRPYYTGAPPSPMAFYPKIQLLPSSLTSLRLNNFTPDLLESSYTVLHNLKLLHIQRLSNASQLHGLSALVNLESLHVDSASSLNIGVVTLPPNLTYLKLLGLNVLSLPSTLRELWIDSIPFASLSTLTSLESLNMTMLLTPENLPQIPKSLTRMTMEKCFPYLHVPLRHVCQHLPNLTELDYGHTMTDDDLQWLMDNTRIKTLRTRAIPAVLRVDALLSSALVEFRDDFASTVRRSLEVKYPIWKHTPPFPGWNSHFLIRFEVPLWCTVSSLLSPSLTRLTLSDCCLPPRFGMSLPQTLTELHVSDYIEGLDHRTPRYLPRSLTKLSITVRRFNIYAYEQLPRGITSLTIHYAKKLWSTHARALPPQLLELNLSTTRISNATLAAIPRTITSLGVNSAPTLTAPALDGLPPSITYLSGDFPNTTTEELCNIVQRFHIKLVDFSRRYKGEVDVKDRIFSQLVAKHEDNLEAITEHFHLPPHI